nr:uncharacterized protein LOC111844524 isoform X2 [Paramormyrops kingsleyae]
MPNGSLVFSNVQQNYSATYTVIITKTGFLPKTASITLQVLAQPVCSVQSTNTNLNYTCQTPGDINSLLSFQQLNNTFSTNGSLSLVVPATDALNGMQIICMANQMNITQTCSVTASLGLSRAAILGLAIGIPCGFLLLLLLIALIILCVVCCRRRRQQPKYPAPSSKKETSERHLPLPSTGTNSPVRMATTV